MKQKSVQVVCHDEQLSCTQIEKLVNVFSIGVARAWLDIGFMFLLHLTQMDIMMTLSLQQFWSYVVSMTHWIFVDSIVALHILTSSLMHMVFMKGGVAYEFRRERLQKERYL